MHFTKNILTTLLVTASLIASAQDYLIESTFLGTRTKAELFLIFFQPVDFDVNLYKVTYETPGIDHLPDTASGLIVVPVVPAGTLMPMVVFQHGTTSGPTDVPSRLRGGYEGAMAYAAKGFITLAPDFLGLGDSRGFHPYVHAATEASASLDMLNTTLEFLEFNSGTQPEWDPNYLFVTGYSQGGHASMALHREIEQFWSFVYPVTAATHMAGPYSISGVMRDLILGDNNYGNPAYIAYIALGYQSAYGNLFTEVNEIFAEPYASDIAEFYSHSITLGTLNQRLLASLNAGGNTFPKRMFQDTLLEAVINNPNHRFNLALADNDTYQWSPDAPTRLYYCSGDEQVPYQNSIVAEAAMQALGAPDVLAIDWGAQLDHGFCAIPSVINSIQFFLSFLNPSSVVTPGRPVELLTVYPNPAHDEITVTWDKALDGMIWQIISTSGQVVSQGQAYSNRVQIDPLPGGMYAILCTAGGETRVARFIHL